MNNLKQFPSLQAFGEQLDKLAERDACLARGPFVRRLVRRPALSRLVPTARFAVTLGTVTALVATGYAVPTTRAAVDDLYDSTLANWFAGDDTQAPGRSTAPGEDLPDWLASEQANHGRGDTRVLAEADGQKLVALRQGDTITLGVADFSQTTSVDDLRQELRGQKIRFLTAGQFLPNGRHDLRPIFGLVSASVKRIQLNYADGTAPDSQNNLDGSFGFTIQTNHRPTSLTAYDNTGRLVARKRFIPDSRHATARTDVVGDFRYCPGAAGCPPWPKLP